MCATVLAPQIAMTTPFEAAARYQGSDFRRVEDAGDRKQRLARKWVVVIDEHGNRKLRMRWTVAPFLLPSTVSKTARPSIEAAAGLVSNPILGLQARLATS